MKKKQAINKKSSKKPKKELKKKLLKSPYSFETTLNFSGETVVFIKYNRNKHWLCNISDGILHFDVCNTEDKLNAVGLQGEKNCMGDIQPVTSGIDYVFDGYTQGYRTASLNCIDKQLQQSFDKGYQAALDEVKQTNKEIITFKNQLDIPKDDSKDGILQVLKNILGGNY